MTRKSALGMCFGLVTAAALLVACQSLGSNPLVTAFGGRQISRPFPGEHRSHAWRVYGHVRRLLTFPTQIQHVVVISMENRTVDNLFAGMYNVPWTGQGGGSWGTALDLHDPNGNPTLSQISLGSRFDPNHLHDLGWALESQGLWGAEPIGCISPTNCPSGATALAYVQTSDTTPYQFIVKTWAFASNVLQANEGPSFPAHQYFIAGQSGGLPGGLHAPDAEAENPRPTPSPLGTGNYADSIYDAQGDVSGCDSNMESMKTVNMLLPPPSPSAPPFPDIDNGIQFTHPCENYNTILDEIAATQGLPQEYDWQYIASTEHSIWAAPLGVQHLHDPYENSNDKGAQPFAVDPDAENFVLNITGASPSPARPFAALTYITPCGHESDHPMGGTTHDGPAWLAWVINAIGESQYWNTTAIIVTWDDWGGWYDHEPPVPSPGPIRPFPNSYQNNPKDPYEWGFRVPLMVISPYAKQGYISNASTSGFHWRSQSAILQYVEHTFGLASLNADDLQEGHSDELLDMFNYGASPQPYTPIPSPTFIPGTVGSCPGMGPSYRRPLKGSSRSIHARHS